MREPAIISAFPFSSFWCWLAEYMCAEIPEWAWCFIHYWALQIGEHQVLGWLGSLYGLWLSLLGSLYKVLQRQQKFAACLLQKSESEQMPFFSFWVCSCSRLPSAIIVFALKLNFWPVNFGFALSWVMASLISGVRAVKHRNWQHLVFVRLQHATPAGRPWSGVAIASPSS